ncbi:MAG: PAS domain S-box protein [Chitinophagaceae bacterium]
MKVKFLHSVTVSNLLIASYCGLLIFVALIRFTEYKQIREAAGKINAISETANQKHEQLVSISQGYAAEQKTIFPYIHNICKKGTQAHNYNAGLAIAVNKNNLLAYQKSIRTDIERKPFDRLLFFEEVTRRVNDSLLLLAAETNPQKQPLERLVEKKMDAYTNFNAAVQQLLDLVSKESKLEIADASKHIMVLARRMELSSYLVIMLLLVLGLSIGNTLRKLRRTESKYRLLFDLSPLPKYIIDPTDYRILDVNTATVKLYGYSREDFLKMTPFDLRRIKCKEQENLKAELHIFSEAGNSSTGKARHFKKSSEPIEVEINSHTIFLGDRKVILVTINDITEKEKMEKEITGAIIKTQEDERRKLGSELHDNVGQILASTQIFLGMVMEAEHDNKEKYLAETRKYLTLAINEIRDLSHRVFPAFLEVISFPEAIDNLLEGMNPDGNLSIMFEYDSCLLTEFINSDIKLNIYRILQEQLKNIQKYSKATEINIELRTKDNRIHLKITDNGIGFDSNKIKPGIGLMNIKKRAELFSGKFVLETAPQKGCSITVEIPIITDKAA